LEKLDKTVFLFFYFAECQDEKEAEKVRVGQQMLGSTSYLH